MDYKRLQYNEIKGRIDEPRGKIQVIVGPRQVSKSTLIGQVLEECDLPHESYSADDIINADANWLAQVWETQRLKMDALNESKRLLIGAYLVSQAQIIGYKVYYWRDKSDEVDYILTYRNRKVAIEVKSGRRTKNVGIVKFAQLYHPYRTIIVGSGGLSTEEFLTMDLALLFK